MLRDVQRTRRVPGVLVRCLIAVALATVACAGLVPAGLAAPTSHVAPTQRVDAKVLLLSANGQEPDFAAWKDELEREGVPYDAHVSFDDVVSAGRITSTRRATLTDATLADYGAGHARYGAVILATGDLSHGVTNPDGSTSYVSALSDAEWSALARLEREFGIRQLSNFTFPSAAHGLILAGTGGPQDGTVGTLTAAGRAAFPYLTGEVRIADDNPSATEAFGYRGTPAVAADWETLLAGPGGTALLGIYTHPDDGREEMVSTVSGNQYQSHVQLLRHGMLAWVTRGVFLGYQRHYLEMHVDDLFLGDDAWDPTTNTTNYGPASASRMTPGDVARAAAWSRANGFRLDMAYNGGGVDLHEAQTGADDPLLAAVRDPATRTAFGFINHTLEHPNLNCSTASYIKQQIVANRDFATINGLPLASGSELITGEHSGLANAVPGNPGALDPPGIEDPVITPAPGGVPAGVYQWGVTAASQDVATNETPASITADVTVGTGAADIATYAASVPFSVVCGAVRYRLYRRAQTGPGTYGAWALVGTRASAASTPTDDGASEASLTIDDPGTPGTPQVPPTANTAVQAPYGQNPQFFEGLASAGVATTATDASKPYPDTSQPGNPFGATLTSLLPAGASFFEGTAARGFRAVPRHPTNVYYNTSTQGQQLDEYNWLYVAQAAGGGCTPIAGVTTCRTAPATWGEFVASENRTIFRHVMDNDPRPHYVHQSNLADYDPALPVTDPAQGGILYPVLDDLLANWYGRYVRRDVAPLVQLTQTEVAATLAREEAWAAARTAGTVSAFLQDGRLHVRNTGSTAIAVPITGTDVGTPYAGQTSGWDTLAPGAERTYSPRDPASSAAPTVTGTPVVAGALSATRGAWTGTPAISSTLQWQRCDDAGAACRNIAGATGATYAPVAADEGRRLRVAVTAGNWVSSVSQAVSAPSAIVRAAADAPTPPGDAGRPAAPVGGAGSGAGAGSRPPRVTPRLALTKLSMSPRRFAVSHRRALRGSKLDGTRVTWRLNRAATVRLTVQRLGGTGRHRRWVTVAATTRSARAGTGVARLTGRFGRKLLTPRRYRLAVTSTAGRQRTATKHVTFWVVAG